ncbi:MAG: SpaA isopeptide-forming pilin-related protein [Lachnospiraceae bacterium]|nr:SpaA isopeptide-forming pilin-related protein [Lachnospiraceae bacterium]
MSNFQHKRGGLIIILTSLLTFMLSGVSVSAKDAPDVEIPGSITITLNDEDAFMPELGASLELFKAGELYVDDADSRWVLTPEFEDSGADLSDLELEELPASLAAYAEESDLDALDTVLTDENGVAVFQDLSVGLYLVIQTAATMGYKPVMPFLVSIPVSSADGEEWIYDVDANPKLSYGRLTPGGGGGSETPPDTSITPTIITPGGGKETVTPPLGSVTPTPSIPLSTTTPTPNTRTTVTPTKTIVTTTPRATTTPSSPLPKTGQLWWPVPVLAAIGLIFVFAGLKRRSK